MYDIAKLTILGECLLIEAEKDPLARTARVKQARRALEAADHKLERLFRNNPGVTEELSRLRKRVNSGISRCLALASTTGKLFPFRELFCALEEAEKLLTGACSNMQLHRAIDAMNVVEHIVMFHLSSGHELPETIGERVKTLRGYAEQLTV